MQKGPPASSNGSAVAPNGLPPSRQGGRGRESLVPASGLGGGSIRYSVSAGFANSSHAGPGTGVPTSREDKRSMAPRKHASPQKQLEDYEKRLYDALENIEERISDVEGEYLQKTHHQGNLVIGFDPAEKTNARRNMEENRIFSQSSVFMSANVDSEGPGASAMYQQHGLGISDIPDNQSNYEPVS